MKFGSIAILDAVGMRAAHSIRIGGLSLRKGQPILEDIATGLFACGVREIVAFTFEAGDVDEDQAAALVAGRLLGPEIRFERPVAGRCSLYATKSSFLRVNDAGIDAVNAVHEAVTVATLAGDRPVRAAELVATVKIVPYAVPERVLAEVCAVAAPSSLRVSVYKLRRVSVVSTRQAGSKESVIDKTLDNLAARLKPTGATIVADRRVRHAIPDVAEELDAATRMDAPGLIVVFGASAATDRRDVVPAAIELAGGRINHLGIPVDPGNLLLLAERRGLPVVGAPGCARSHLENGFDWVLHRLLSRESIDRSDLMGLGVGGLLASAVSRRHSREAS